MRKVTSHRSPTACLTVGDFITYRSINTYTPPKRKSLIARIIGAIKGGAK